MENQNSAPIATPPVRKWYSAHLRNVSGSVSSTAVKAGPLGRNDLKIYQIKDIAKHSLFPE